MRNGYKILVGKPVGKRPFGGLGMGLYGRLSIILKWLLKWDVSVWTGFIGLWLRIGKSGGAFVNPLMNLRVTYT
jgi:hypothetical protein